MSQIKFDREVKEIKLKVFRLAEKDPLVLLDDSYLEFTYRLSYQGHLMKCDNHSGGMLYILKDDIMKLTKAGSITRAMRHLVKIGELERPEEVKERRKQFAELYRTHYGRNPFE